MIIFLYVVLLFLVLRFTVTLFNFLSNPKLGHYGKKFQDKVSIIILSDANQTVQLIESIHAQDYENLEIIYAESQNADKAANDAQGNYILFLDKNCIIKKGLINGMLYRMKVFDLALLSLIPSRTFSKVTEWIFGPLSEFVLFNLLPLRTVRLFNSPIFSATNNSCMLFDAARYKENKWFAELQDRGWSDSRVGRLIKEKKFSAEILIANKMLYKSSGKSIDNIGKELFENFDNNLFAALGFVLLSVIGPVILFRELDFNFFTLPLGLIFLTRVMTSFLSGQNPIYNLLLHPFQMASLGYLLIMTSLKKMMTTGKHNLE